MESRQPQGSSSQSLPNSSRVRFAEEQPGLEAVQSQPTLRIREEIPGPLPGPPESTAPEVYWADDRSNDANLAQYTFYREPTPPPPPLPDYEERHKKEYGSSAVTASGGSAGSASRMEDGRGFPPNGQQGDDDWSSTSSAGVVCGVRKNAFWTIIAIVIMFLIALALGVGLGVGLNKPSAPSAPSPTSTSSPAISDTDGSANPAPSSTPTTVPGSTATTIIPLTTCPAANNTLYTTTTTDDSKKETKKTFLRVCGIDFSGVGGATDIRHLVTDSMADCMDACAEEATCTGCGWGRIPGDKGDGHRCWLKKDLQTQHNATQDWDFAILQLVVG